MRRFHREQRRVVTALLADLVARGRNVADGLLVATHAEPAFYSDWSARDELTALRCDRSLACAFEVADGVSGLGQWVEVRWRIGVTCPASRERV